MTHAPATDPENPPARFRLSITPEPTPDERDAIVAALTALSFQRGAATTGEAQVSRWAMAGRLQAMRQRAAVWEARLGGWRHNATNDR